MHANIKPLFDARAIHARVQALGQRLQREVAHEDPLILSLLGGSVIFLADLVRSISTSLRYEFVDVETHAQQGGEAVQDFQYPIPIDIRGQSLLVLKDVVSTAIVETYLATQLLQRGARKVRFAALVDLPKERKTHCQIDYSVFTTERAGRLVGYGMKVNGRNGNLPYIGYLEEEAPESSARERG
ncbi:MAG TPA: phosphoribosyltransferase family protein [Thermoanaerobaculia bacterium]|nr:phosphoribosyltransferase family protein [Thermoanaerobaculia bacterium]